MQHTISTVTRKLGKHDFRRFPYETCGVSFNIGRSQTSARQREVDNAANCRKQAAVVREKTEKARSPTEKATWSKVADEWLTLDEHRQGINE